MNNDLDQGWTRSERDRHRRTLDDAVLPQDAGALTAVPVSLRRATDFWRWKLTCLIDKRSPRVARP